MNDHDEPELEADPISDEEEGARQSRLVRLARRLMDRKELAEDTKELLLSMASTSDKAKTEAVRMVAREARAYLEDLGLKDDIKSILTGYSLEISLHLKPLPETAAADESSDDEETTS